MENNLYQIAVPVNTNAGESYGQQRAHFESYVLEAAGGFTDEGTKVGVWRDPASGVIYDDLMKWYSIMASDVVMAAVTHRAFLLFPDQKAFFVSQIGTASIIETPAVVGGE